MPAMPELDSQRLLEATKRRSGQLRSKRRLLGGGIAAALAVAIAIPAVALSAGADRQGVTVSPGPSTTGQAPTSYALTARIALNTDRTAAGSPIDGTITFTNQTGHPIAVNSCSPTWTPEVLVGLTNATIPFMDPTAQSLAVGRACGGTSLVPMGRSTFPIDIRTTYQVCSQQTTSYPGVAWSPPCLGSSNDIIPPLPAGQYTTKTYLWGVPDGTETPPPISVTLTGPTGPSTSEGPARICDPSHLCLNAVQASGSGGHLAVLVTFTNQSETACAMGGYPTAWLLDATGLQIGTLSGQAGAIPPPALVTLQPGGEASTTVWYDNPGVPDPPCSTDTVTTVQVAPPGQSVALSAHIAFPVCRAPDPHVLTTPITSGSSQNGY